MMMMMVALHFNGNVYGFHDSFCMEMCMMLYGNMNTNPGQWKKKMQFNSFVHLNDRQCYTVYCLLRRTANCIASKECHQNYGYGGTSEDLQIICAKRNVCAFGCKSLNGPKRKKGTAI